MKTQRQITISILLGIIILYGYIYKFILSNPLNFSNPIGDLIYFGILIPIVALILFSFLIRKKTWAEPYFTSKYNLLNEKVRYSKEYTIPKELLIDKITEVIEQSDFNVIDINKEKSKLFAITKSAWNSLGENLYISLTENQDFTQMNVCGTTAYGRTSWGKNEKNINNLINQIEDSLII